MTEATPKFIWNENHEIIPEADTIRWINWMGKHRVVKRDIVRADPQTIIQTDFLGYTLGEQPPQFFETLVFGGMEHGKRRTSASHAEAMAVHAAEVERQTALTSGREPVRQLAAG